MKTKILVSLAFLVIQLSYAQSDIIRVTETIQNYIDGSSYNTLDLLENAFAENATLYLTIRDTFRTITPKEYMSFFNGKEGEFNGRHGKILAIDIYEDIATAKAEILIPERNWLFIDLFLLKKTEKGWKIISKTATRTVTNTKGE